MHANIDHESDMETSSKNILHNHRNENQEVFFDRFHPSTNCRTFLILPRMHVNIYHESAMETSSKNILHNHRNENQEVFF